MFSKKKKLNNYKNIRYSYGNGASVLSDRQS